VAVATRAFDADPFYRWLWPERRTERVRRLMRLALRRCRVRREAAGFVAWHAPDVADVRAGLADVVPASGLALRIMIDPCGWRRLARGVGVLRELARARPREPHVHLELLAVDAAARGQGVGKRLLGDLLAHADGRGWPVVLETTNPDNLALYRRFGFEVTHEARRAGVPPAWSMRRPVPRP